MYSNSAVASGPLVIRYMSPMLEIASGAVCTWRLYATRLDHKSNWIGLAGTEASCLIRTVAVIVFSPRQVGVCPSELPVYRDHMPQNLRQGQGRLATHAPFIPLAWTGHDLSLDSPNMPNLEISGMLSFGVAFGIQHQAVCFRGSGTGSGKL